MKFLKHNLLVDQLDYQFFMKLDGKKNHIDIKEGHRIITEDHRKIPVIYSVLETLDFKKVRHNKITDFFWCVDFLSLHLPRVI